MYEVDASDVAWMGRPQPKKRNLLSGRSTGRSAASRRREHLGMNEQWQEETAQSLGPSLSVVQVCFDDLLIELMFRVNLLSRIFSFSRACTSDSCEFTIPQAVYASCKLALRAYPIKTPKLTISKTEV